MDFNNKDLYYKIYKVPKPHGGYRQITEPIGELKELQQELAVEVNDNYEISDHTFGFRKGFSSVDAASRHVCKDWLLNIDIKDFFPSIKNEHVGFLSEYQREVALFNGSLPQGSPCSPVITNVVMKDIDNILHDNMKIDNIDYSRYADDISLSGMGRVDISRMIEYVSNELLKLGFIVNKKKTSFMPKYKRQQVLGINVNTGVSISRETRKNLRSAIHHGNITDVEEGMLAYIQMVNKGQHSSLVKRRGLTLR